MSELTDKIKASIERVKSYEPVAMKRGGYYVAFSGGKDSVALKTIMDMAGVKYDAHYSLTTVDPPELVAFVKQKHKDVKIETPHYRDGKPVTMWNLIEKKVNPPTRIHRFCCAYLKENGGDGRFTVTGVRWAESQNRKTNQGIITIMEQTSDAHGSENFTKTPRGGVVLVNDNEESRRTLEQCIIRSKTVLNPLIEWTDSDIWNFIRGERIPYCDLYDEGFHRLGCIGCPMATRRMREREFFRWPKYKNLYLLAFEKMLKRREEKGLKEMPYGKDPESVYKWWLMYEDLPGQINIFEEEYEN